MSIVMSWSKCSVEIGKTGADDAMAAVLSSIGEVEDKTAVLEATDGEALEKKGTGGRVIAFDQLEGGFALTVRVVEPDDALYTTLGLGAVAAPDYDVKTHVVAGDWSVKVTPNNVGAVGIKAPKTNIKFKPGWSDADGSYADITFTFIKTAADKWYTRFKKA